MGNKSEDKKKEMPFLTLVAFFIVTVGLAIASGLTLAVEPFCADFKVLCGAGFFTLAAIGVGVSTMFILVGALVLYCASLSWNKAD